ncbi:cation:proton antiporter [Hoylesella buccalis]|uniref:cation:proton antiporter n=1 Tax=Hoylesella buccalis TaxID=28127 RepID=UPI0005102FE0|nr:cation:proton antiporter [Hoylesella buccalis]KGF40202.1 sodium:proton antiporter [Hoylesella buccalis DNF00985]
MSQLSAYFPISDPTLIFLVVLLVILLAPIVMGKLRIPHIIGMVLAGVLLGEHGLNILDRDNSFELFGNVGLYYIMFLAALEMDVEGVKKNKYRMLTFGLLTFAIPLALVYVSSVSILRYSVMSSLLLGCIMASNTLVAYPIVSRYGLQRKPSVMLSVGSTMLSLLLALTLLAGIVASYQSDANLSFWLFFALKFAVYCVAMIMLIPRLTRWFLRSYSDAVMQYVFVMLMMFMSAALSAAVGFEGIFGAFFAGLILNRYIPAVSPLMNRIEFIGNALFIPYFLIGVGMLINLRGLFSGGSILLILFVITVMGTLGKLLAAYVSCIGFRLPLSSGTMMFGLTSAHAAGAIAMVMVGMKIETAPGVYLVDDDLLNGVVLMILFTCVISTLVTEHSAQKITLRDQDVAPVESANENDEHMLIPVKYPEYADHLVNLALLMRNKKLNRPLTALNVVYEDENMRANQEKGRRLLEQVSRYAAGSDVAVQTQVRIAVNIANGIKHAFQEFRASEIIIGMHTHTEVSKKFWGQFHQSLVNGLNCQIVMARLMQPLNTLRRIVVAVPSRAQFEPGFYRWLERLSRMAAQLECRIQFHGRDDTLALIRQYVLNRHQQVRAEFVEMTHWNEVPKLAANIAVDHMFVVVAARKGTVSYKNALENLAEEIRQYFSGKTLLIIFPDQYGTQDEDMTFSQSQHTEEHSAYEVLGSWIKNALGKRKW